MTRKKHKLTKYCGITHGKTKIIKDDYLSCKWESTKCSKGIHLFDEVLSDQDHYLCCDVCGLIVHIERIDYQYCSCKKIIPAKFT